MRNLNIPLFLLVILLVLASSLAFLIWFLPSPAFSSLQEGDTITVTVLKYLVVEPDYEKEISFLHSFFIEFSGITILFLMILASFFVGNRKGAIGFVFFLALIVIVLFCEEQSSSPGRAVAVLSNIAMSYFVGKYYFTKFQFRNRSGESKRREADIW